MEKESARVGKCGVDGGLAWLGSSDLRLSQLSNKHPWIQHLSSQQVERTTPYPSYTTPAPPHRPPFSSRPRTPARPFPPSSPAYPPAPPSTSLTPATVPSHLDTDAPRPPHRCRRWSYRASPWFSGAVRSCHLQHRGCPIMVRFEQSREVDKYNERKPT